MFDRPVELSAKEYDLLVTLAGEPTRVFTRAELMRGDLGTAHVRAYPHARQPRLAVAAQAVRRRRGQAGDQRLGRRLPAPARRFASDATPPPRFDERPTTRHRERRRALPAAGGRARRGGAGRARERAHRRGAVRPSAAALEDAAGALLHAAATFIALDGPLPGLFAEQAGALLAVAARFEEAADLTRARRSD